MLARLLCPVSGTQGDRRALDAAATIALAFAAHVEVLHARPDHAAFVPYQGSDCGAVGQHHEHHRAGAGLLGRVGRDAHTLQAGQRLSRLRQPVVDDEPMARSREMTRHGPPHAPDADETDGCRHGQGARRSRSQAPSGCRR